jgi:predicted CxxxxCH...CXXCH cytochrome family protein
VGCHGDWARGWRAGVTHRQRAEARSLHGTGTNYECKDCHALEASSGNYPFTTTTNDWAQTDAGATTKHGDVQITINDDPANDNITGWKRGTGGAKPTDRSVCEECHSGNWNDSGPDFHWFQKTGWNSQEIVGDGVEAACYSCHGDGVSQYWPTGGGSDYWNDNVNSSSRHDAHIAAIANYKWTQTLAQLKSDPQTDTKQKTACSFCHGALATIGAGGHNSDSGDQRVNVAGAGAFRKFTGSTNDALDTGSGAYSLANANCSNLVCHNLSATPSGASGWNGTGSPNCTTLCHTPNNTSVAREGHEEHVVTRSYGCTECHVNNGTDNAHINGQVQFAFTGMEQTYGGGDATYSGGASVTYQKPTAATGTCANVYCHVDKTTPAWNTVIDNTACTACHQTGQTAAPNPSSGLHYGSTAPTVTGQWHDNTLDPTKKCTVCHTTLFSQLTHVNGIFQGGNGQKTQMGLIADYTQTADNVGTCMGTPGIVGGVGCHDGGGDAGRWARRWDRTIHYATDGTECKGCHGGLGTNDWTFGTDDAVGDGQVSHGKDWDTNATADVIGNHSGNTDQNDKCNICHVYSDAPYGQNGNSRIGWVGRAAPDNSTYHGDDKIQMNDSLSYSRTSPAYGCGSNCHTTPGSHLMENSGWTLDPINGPALSCASCHGPGGSGPTVVWPSGGAPYGTYGSHLKALSTETLSGSTDWNIQCVKCHPSDHSAGAGVYTIPPPPTSWDDNNGGTGLDMQTILGLNIYASNGGIHLGGTSAQGANEARMCWNCHKADTTGVGSHSAEFGVNNNSNTGSLAYNYGTLSTWGTSDNGAWLSTANWTSGTGIFIYKTDTLRSMHSVNFTAGVSGNDTDSNIRCTYCHDVHDTNKSKRGTYGDNVTGEVGPPHLRGSWKGNPYKEDGAPLSGQTYDSNPFGAVPRGMSTHSTTLNGGFWIDQNTNPNPTGKGGKTSLNWTLANSAGLCVLCHNDQVNTMNLTTGEATFPWMGTGYTTSNGHANAAIGGTGTASGRATNIFGDGIGGRPTPVLGASGNKVPWSNNIVGNMNMKAQSAYTGGAWLRNGAASDPLPSWYPWYLTDTDVPPNTGAGSSAQLKIQGTGADNWGVTVDAGTTQSQYHQFSCSKCHNPHASRLPRLMITNCLDTKHNTWDDDKLGPPDSIGSAETGVTINREMANWSSAVNCHRLDTDGTPGLSNDGGWNKVTPW